MKTPTRVVFLMLVMGVVGSLAGFLSLDHAKAADIPPNPLEL